MKAPNDYTDLLASDPTRYSRTAPPAENGVSVLLFWLAIALLIAPALSSCAPARLPLGTVARPVGHDPRTKLVEPMPAKSVR